LTNPNSAAGAKGLLGMATSTTFNSGMLLHGYIYNSSWNWTVGSVLYLNAAASGLITSSAPSGTGDIVRIVGFALSADLIYFDPSQDWVEIA
jgi:hypothetical protein